MRRVLLLLFFLVLMPLNALAAKVSAHKPLTPKPQYQLKTGIIYSTSQQAMDLYVPYKPHPAAVILVHGGGWAGGDRTQMNDYATLFASHGYLSANIDYRLAPQSHYPDPVNDVRESVRFLQTHASAYGIDPDKIVLLGVSAGGHLVLMTALDQSGEHDASPAIRPVHVAGVISIAGPTDLNPDQFAKNPDLQKNLQAFLNDARPDDVSPLTFVHSADTPSVFLMHGDADTIVPVDQTLRMAAALKAIGAPVRVIIYPGAGHEIIIPTRDRSAIFSALLDFVAKLDQ